MPLICHTANSLFILFWMFTRQRVQNNLFNTHVHSLVLMRVNSTRIGRVVRLLVFQDDYQYNLFLPPDLQPQVCLLSPFLQCCHRMQLSLSLSLSVTLSLSHCVFLSLSPLYLSLFVSLSLSLSYLSLSLSRSFSEDLSGRAGINLQQRWWRSHLCTL